MTRPGAGAAGKRTGGSAPKPPHRPLADRATSAWDSSAQDAALTRLAAGATAMRVHLSPGQMAQLMGYLGLLRKWSQVYNLTAVRDPIDMVNLHLLDSLSAIAPLRRHLQLPALDAHAQATPLPSSARQARVLDVGSGAGLPGLVMAITCPELEIVCVDTVSKKAAFVQQAALTLGLHNLAGQHARVETITMPHEVICARAFASLHDFTRWTSQALSPDGVWMAMKGKHPAEEIATLPPAVSVFHVEPLVVPGLDADRCLVWMRRE